VILKKKSPNLPGITQQWFIFEISIVSLWQEMADNRPINNSKVPASSKFLPNFVFGPNSKICQNTSKQLPPKKIAIVFFLCVCVVTLLGK